MKKALALKLLRKKYGNISNEELVENIAESLGVEINPNPINKVEEIEDDPLKCYVWDTDMTDSQVTRFAQQFKNEFVKKYGRDPQSLHFIRNDIDGIEELSPEEVRSRVSPWLKQAEARE